MKNTFKKHYGYEEITIRSYVAFSYRFISFLF